MNKKQFETVWGQILDICRDEREETIYGSTYNPTTLLPRLIEEIGLAPCLQVFSVIVMRKQGDSRFYPEVQETLVSIFCDSVAEECMNAYVEGLDEVHPFHLNSIARGLLSYRKEHAIYTHNEAAEIVELFENILSNADIKVPDVDDNQRDPNNDAVLFGETYSHLLDEVEEHLIHLLKKSSLPIISGVFR